MESRIKLLGHPLHPMLIVFPLGLLLTAAAFDVVYLATGTTHWTMVSFRMMWAGALVGVLAALPGAIDWLAIPTGTRAKWIGGVHGFANLGALILYFILIAARSGDPAHPTTLNLGVTFFAAGLLLLGGWLGGELVDRLGVGVAPGAHLNSPNSLSGRPAHDGPRREP
jgi:uncharacterized membrane protein